MKRKISLFIAFIFLLSLCFMSSALGDETTPSTSGKCTPLFFKAIDQNGNYIFLLGTIHLGFKDWYPLPEVIMTSLQDSEELLTEVDLSILNNPDQLSDVLKDPGSISDLLKYGIHMLTAKSKLLSEVFDEKQLQLLSEHTGKSIEELSSLTVSRAVEIIPSYMYNEAGCSILYGIDVVLAKYAGEKGIRITGIETLGSQLNVLSVNTDEQNEKTLVELVTHYPEEVEALKQLLNAYASGDINAIKETLSADTTATDNPELNKAMMTDRNVEFVKVAKEYLEKGKKAFIAIGAAHIIADDGIVPVLQSEGYTIEQLCP